MSESLHTPFQPLPASSIEKHARATVRRPKLIGALRHVARLACEEHYDEPELAERCRLARLVAACDDVLRGLVNTGKQAA